MGENTGFNPKKNTGLLEGPLHLGLVQGQHKKLLDPWAIEHKALCAHLGDLGGWEGVCGVSITHATKPAKWWRFFLANFSAVKCAGGIYYARHGLGAPQLSDSLCSLRVG